MKTSASTSRYFLTLLAAGLVTLFGSLSVAYAQTPTVITSLPYVVNASGLYVLDRNLSSSQTSGTLIDIQANNVTIDFQGHFISGPSGATNQNTYGVSANEKSNINLKNGIIAYCYYGIRITGNSSATTNNVGHLIDGMRVTYCTFVGISCQYSQASRIQNCQVSKIGSNSASNAYGIEGFSAGISVLNNTVTSITASISYGIYTPSSFARQNTVNGATYGIYGGKYQDNLTLNCTTNVSGGTDAGGNN